MEDNRKSSFVDGIIVMSNPFTILIVIAVMLLVGWLTLGELTPVLLGVAIAYLILSVIGGHLAKQAKKNHAED